MIFIFQSGGPSQHETFDPKPEAPDTIRGEYLPTQTKLPGVWFCEHLPKLAARADQFSVVRTMHHIAGPEFRNEHSSCSYLLHTGSTSLPEGDTNATIVQPRPGRMSWPSIGAMIAYAAPPDSDVAWPAVIELPRTNLMTYPGRGPGLVGPQYDRLGVDLAPPCHAKDAAGSCPNCFSHDDPNLDSARMPGPGPKAWWDNSSCRNPDFHLPDLARTEGISLPRLDRRADLLNQLERMRTELDRMEVANRFAGWDAYRRQALRFVLSSRPGQRNPFDLTQEPDRV
ncbi:MAG TPA: DUF1501 domain-containing protein, partial [Planctomycetaceae bacterium]|nr:DUF1501 domain-containing protein [Planctomycetaceae bacterium]